MITSEKINTIQRKVKTALAEIEREENVKIEFGSCSYTAAYYNTKMVVTTQEKNDKVDKTYENISKQYGFTQNIIGMEFDVRSKSGPVKVTIEKFNTRSPKFPVMGKGSDGLMYKFTVDQTKRYLGGDKLINRTKNLENLTR